MAEPRDSLELVAVRLEAAGELAAAKQVAGWLAELDKPERKAEEPEPAKRSPGRPRKEA